MKTTFLVCLAAILAFSTTALAKKTAERCVGPAKLADIRSVVGYLGREPFDLSPGVTVSVGQLLEQRDFPRLESAPKPTYVFDPAGGKTDTWADRGIQKYGPYSLQTFSKNRPRIAVICQAMAKLSSG